VRASRGTLDPQSDAGILTASFCIPPYLYDGHMVRTDSVAEFIEVLKKADRENKPLFFNIGMPWAAREYSPGMWALFNRPELFENHHTFTGLDAGRDRIVARYKPGSLATFDLSAYQLDGRWAQTNQQRYPEKIQAAATNVTTACCSPQNNLSMG